MVPIRTLSEVENIIRQEKAKDCTVVGLMFANYPKGLEETFSNYYKAWNIQTMDAFNIYWMGYDTGLNFEKYKKEKDYVYIVNFDLQNSPNKVRIIKSANALDDILTISRNSEERMYFHAGQYEQAKKEIHDKIKSIKNKNTKVNLRISEWMLLLVQCKNGELQFDGGLLPINFVELKSEKNADLINDIILQLSDICADEKEYKKVVEEINAYIKKKKKGSVSIKEFLKKFSVEGSVTANPVTGEIKVSGKVNSSK